MKKQRNAQSLAAIAALLSAALLLGCGAAEDDRKLQQLLSGTTTPAATVVGMKTCTQCHWETTNQWLQTPHANMNPNDPGDLSFVGDPSTSTAGWSVAACGGCHDLDTDSANLIANVTGNVARPVVGCEACHGGGSNHNGTGPIGPYRVAATTVPTTLTTAAATISVVAKTTNAIEIYATSVTTGFSRLSVSANNTFARTSGSFLTNGFTAGMSITTSGFTNGANNGTFTIQSVTATQIVVTVTTLAGEAAGNDRLINSATAGAANMLVRRTAGSFLTDGFVAGMTITTSDFTNAANNGTFTIKSVIASVITITASTLVTETTGGGNETITATNTFQRTVGSFITDGFAPGMIITTSGFTGVNNGTFTILRVTDNVGDSNIEVTSSTLVAEGAAGGRMITSNARTVTSSQFATCTACHELVDAGGVQKAPAYHVAGAPASAANYITDTHFAEAGDFRCDDTGAVFNDNSQTINCNDVSGYAIDFSDSNACTNCHAVHKDGSVININREWAASRHANKAWDKAWAHYNWSCDGTTAESCGTSTTTGLPSSRTSCQRCHTTTGFTAYVNALQAGNTSLAKSINDGTSILPNFFSSGFKPEMLQCRGCHSDNNGTLRAPGAYLAYYGGTITHQFADLGGSNVCLPCHAGRKSGDYIGTITDKFKTGRAIRDVEAHYLTAGGVMFAAAGYEYPNRSYAIPTSFKHDKVGTSALAIDGGTNGPCVGCHMYRPGAAGNHLFKALNVTGGLITGITSDVCFNVTCHPGSNFKLTEDAEAEKTHFESALAMFAVQLQESPDSKASAYKFKPYTTTANAAPVIPLTNITSPYFGASSTSTNVVWDAADDTGNTRGKNNIGAAFNFLFLHDDPGAYVHNSKYTKRLIYDSLDWLDDYMLNYSVGASLTALTDSKTMVNLDAAPPDGIRANAKTYLLPYGSLWSVGGVWNSNPALSTGYGNSAERP